LQLLQQVEPSSVTQNEVYQPRTILETYINIFIGLHQIFSEHRSTPCSHPVPVYWRSNPRLGCPGYIIRHHGSVIRPNFGSASSEYNCCYKTLTCGCFLAMACHITGLFANQRSPYSVEEDAINKPWRPMPSKRITRNQLNLLLNAVRLLSCILSYRLSVVMMYAMYFVLLAGYNDFGGADRSGVSRNIFCGTAFACLFSSALSIALGSNTTMTRQAWTWTLSITLGVLTSTFHTQDFRDETGDRSRGRKTLVTELGREPALWTVAIAISFWSLYMPLVFLRAGWLAALLPILCGSFVIATAIQARTHSTVNLNRRMYKLWCLWVFSFCPLPILANLGI
jgi:4-hydroxybenzoate polyprenyltransferase